MRDTGLPIEDPAGTVVQYIGNDNRKRHTEGSRWTLSGLQQAPKQKKAGKHTEVHFKRSDNEEPD